MSDIKIRKQAVSIGSEPATEYRAELKWTAVDYLTALDDQNEADMIASLLKHIDNRLYADKRAKVSAAAFRLFEEVRGAPLYDSYNSFYEAWYDLQRAIEGITLLDNGKDRR